MRHGTASRDAPFNQILQGIFATKTQESLENIFVLLCRSRILCRFNLQVNITVINIDGHMDISSLEKLRHSHDYRYGLLGAVSFEQGQQTGPITSLQWLVDIEDGPQCFPHHRVYNSLNFALKPAVSMVQRLGTGMAPIPG